MANETQQTLHTPQSSTGTAQSMKSIMDAYKTQAKIPLYDENSAMSAGAANENVGVTGKNIPLSMLRPSQTPVQSIDENGNVIRQRPSRGQIAREVESYGDIANAYRKMNGQAPVDEGYADDADDADGAETTPTATSALDGVKRFEAEYVEDIPEDEEGLLGILELVINNARANLEMLESLYVALGGE